MTLHGLVATEEVLINTGPDVVQTRLSIRRWWTFVKDPGGSTLALTHRPGKDVLVFPADEFGLFERDEVNISTDWTEHISPLVGPIVEDGERTTVRS